MQWGEFTQQMNRVTSTFGKNAYGEERLELIWREVKDFECDWFKRVVEKFIGEFRQAPLIPDFREEIAIERERLWKHEKDKNGKEAKDFVQTLYHPDDKRTICQYIIKRLGGGVSDQDYSQFVKHLDEAPRCTHQESGPVCRDCRNEGLVFYKNAQGESGYVCRCYCMYGQKRSRAYPVYQP